MSIFGAFSSSGNYKHYYPEDVNFDDYMLGDAANLLHPDGQASFESAYVPGDYRVVRDPSHSTRSKQNSALKGAITTIDRNLRQLDEGGTLTQQGRALGQLEPGETYLQELYDEIDLDSKINKTGILQEGIDLIQGTMYGISGGILELMRTGEIDDGFKQFLSEIRHSWDDDYTPDPDSWLSRPVYRAEWGQILRSNDGIIGKKLLDAIDTNPFLAFMDAKSIDDLTDISITDHVKDLGELWNVVSDNNYRQSEVERIRREQGVRNVSLTEAENNAMFWLGLGLDIALDPLTYTGIGFLGKAGKLITGKQAILRGLESGEEVAKRAQIAYNRRIYEDPQSDVAIRRANKKEELEAKIGVTDEATGKPFLEEDAAKGLEEFDEAERLAEQELLTPQRTTLGKISDAVPIDMFSLRDEGYFGKGGAVATGIDNFTNMAMSTLHRIQAIPKVGHLLALDNAFVTNNVVKRLRNKETAKRLAKFIQENATDITGASSDDIAKDELLEHLTGDVDQLAESITERSEEYLKLVKDASIDRQSETQAIKNGMLMLSKRYGLDARYAMSLFAAKPDIAKRLIDEGDYADDIKKQLHEVLNVGESLIKEITLKDRRHGLLDETQLRTDYVPSRAPLSRSGQRTMEAFLKSNVDSDEAQAILNRIEQKQSNQSYQVAMEGDVKATFQNRAVFQDLYGKLLALNPSEMDFAMLYGNRAFESLRLRNTKRFQDHILSDRLLTVPVDEAIAKDPTHKLHKKFKANGFDFYSPAGGWKDEGAVFYAMPKDMSNALKTTNTLMEEAGSGTKNMERLRELGRVWKTGTALWRQWALGTMGYVSRNVQSNIFTNYVAGVTSPHRYLEAALIQWGGTEQMPRGIKEYVELKVGGPKAIQNYKFKLRDGRVLSLQDMRAEMDKNGLFADTFSTNEMVELSGIESATFGIYNKGRTMPTGVISAGIKGMPSWGVTEERVDNATRHIQDMYRDAGNTEVSAEEARAVAEVYDGMARQWAWYNNSVPSAWWDKVTIKGFSDYDQVKTKFVEDTLLQADPTAAAIDKGFDPWYVGNQAEALPALRSLIARKVEANSNLKSKENIWRKNDMGDLVLTFEELQKSFASKIIKKKDPDAARVKKEMGKLNLDSTRNTFIGVEDWLSLNAKENPTGEITKSDFVSALNRGLFRMDAVTQRRGLTPDVEYPGAMGQVTHYRTPREAYEAQTGPPDADFLESTINQERRLGDFYRAEDVDYAKEQWETANPYQDALSEVHDIETGDGPMGPTGFVDPMWKFKTMQLPIASEAKLEELAAMRGRSTWEPEAYTQAEEDLLLDRSNYRVGFITATDVIPRDEWTAITGVESGRYLPGEWEDEAEKVMRSTGFPIGPLDMVVDWRTTGRDSVKQARQKHTMAFPQYRDTPEGRELSLAQDAQIAHYRLSDYVDEDGNKLLVVNELQSDFFTSRRGGIPFIRDEKEERDYYTEIGDILKDVLDDKWHDRATSVLAKSPSDYNEGFKKIIDDLGEGDYASQEARNVIREINTRLNQDEFSIHQAIRWGLPDDEVGRETLAAMNKDFKDLYPINKTDWQAPAMKLLIQEAARGGYSKVIWGGDFDVVAKAEGWDHETPQLLEIAKNYYDEKKKGSLVWTANRILKDVEIKDKVKDYPHPTGNYKSIDITEDLASKALNGSDFTLYQKDANTDKVKGLVSFLDDGRRLVASFREGDVSTMVHELAHIARRSEMIAPGDMQVINNWIFGMDTAKGKSLINKRIDEHRKEYLGDEKGVEWSDEDRLKFVEDYMWTDKQPLPGEKLNAEEKFAKAIEQYVLEGGLKPTGLSSNHISALDRLQESMQEVYRANLDQIKKLFPEDMSKEVKQKINRILGQQVEAEPEKAELFEQIVRSGEEEEARRNSFGARAAHLLLGTEDEYPLSMEGLKKAFGNNAWLRFVRGSARITEHNARAALFINSMVDGMSGAEAAQNVKKYLFDYSELTDFEKNVMRNIIPFYSWLRKNIPLQFQSLIERPAKYANVAKLYSELGDMSLETHGDDPPTPDYFMESLNVRLPENLGNQPTYIMPDLPFIDFETADGILDYDKWIGMAHPVVKMGIEQFTNRKSLTGAPIAKEQGADEPLILGDVNVDEWLGPRTSYALEGLLPPVARAKSTLKDYGRGKAGIELWARSLGINLRTVDVDRVMAQRAYWLRSETNREVQKVRADIMARQKKQARLMGFGDGK